MKSPFERYLELMKEQPHLFAQPEGDGIVIITNPEEIQHERDKLYQKLSKPGEPADWLVIGVLTEDPWSLVIRDLVRFPSGQVGAYLRRLNNKSLKGGFNVVMLPRQGDRFLLINHFRHDDRCWHWEFPRGFGEPGLTDQVGALKELKEELGVSEVKLTELHREVEGPGGTVFYLVDIPANAEITLDKDEASKSAWVSQAELEEWIRSGTLEDDFSMKIYLLYLMKNRSGELNP